MIRDAQFYDFIGAGLASLGYVENGVASLDLYLQDMLAEKWNAEKTYAQMGFPLNPDITMHPTYEQIEATIRPYTMAAYVDYDSDGPTKSTDGIMLKSGELPIFKHEVYLDRKKIRDKMMLIDELGGMRQDIVDAVMDLFFTASDSLIGGNFNTVQFQRHQIVGNQGKLIINSENNPYGLALEIDFGVPAKNIHTSIWFTKKKDGTIVQNDAVGKSINPVNVAVKIKDDAEEFDFMPAGHWECSKKTKKDLLAMEYWRELFAVAMRPDITKDTLRLAWSYTQDDDLIWRYIQNKLGPIEVIDSVGSVEFMNPKTKKAAYHNIQAFKEGVLAYVPDGDIGDVQAGKHVWIDSANTRSALFDGGRTLIREILNGEYMTIKTKSEAQVLCVPNATRWFYYLNIMEVETDSQNDDQQNNGGQEVVATYTPVEDTVGKNPYEQGWYVKEGDTYRQATDTTPIAGVTYYVKS